MASGANWLVLDEPTNHLDLPAIEQLETALERLRRHARCSSPTTGGCSTPSRSTARSRWAAREPGRRALRSAAGAASRPLPWDAVRIATWNVNSVKQRVPRLLPWLDERQPDVVCLQETKLADDAFAELLGGELADRGYEIAVHGEAPWNGVAILSRVGLDDVVRGRRGRARLPAPRGARRLGHVRRHPGASRVYVPNGRVPDSDHYRYKLAWLAALREDGRRRRRRRRSCAAT